MTKKSKIKRIINNKILEHAFANKNDNIGLSIVNNCKNFINYTTPFLLIIDHNHFICKPLIYYLLIYLF